MQKKRESVPATKQDVAMLMESIGKLYDANERWKNEVKRHFDVTVEKIRHDLQGANKDQIENLEDRLDRLEKHAGLVPA